MIFRDDLVKERSESVETFMAARIDTNTRVGPLATREDALLEGVAIFVGSIFARIPHISRQDFREERFGSTGEEGELGDLGWLSEVRTHHHAIGIDSAFAELETLKSQGWQVNNRWSCKATYLA